MRKNLTYNDRMFVGLSNDDVEKQYSKFLKSQKSLFGEALYSRVVADYVKRLDGVKYYFKVIEYSIEY